MNPKFQSQYDENPERIDNLHLDPRCKEILKKVPKLPKLSDSILHNLQKKTRDELINETTQSSKTKEEEEMVLIENSKWNDLLNGEYYEKEVRYDEKGGDLLLVKTIEFQSQPDGNMIQIQMIRPQNNEILPCVYYIHGGGMMIGSSFQGCYKAWGRTIASKGVIVMMVEFRNSKLPSSSTSAIGPFPAGLNDCFSGLQYIYENALELKIQSKKVIIAGESGGGNLTIALALKLKQMNLLHYISGIYAMCPYILGEYHNPSDKNEKEKFSPSSSSVSEFDGLLIQVFDPTPVICYGIEQMENKNILAWPSFAQVDDVIDFPRTFISVNEYDPLKDEGINFYRLLLKAQSQQLPSPPPTEDYSESTTTQTNYHHHHHTPQCRIVMGTIHAAELFLPNSNISHETAQSIVNFVNNS